MLNNEVKQGILEYTKLYDWDKDYLTLYVNTPYCKQRCKYCVWGTHVIKSATDIENHLAALKRQIDELAPLVKRIPVRAVYFGGGTASIYSAAQMEYLFGLIEDNFNLDLDGNQFTMECHPATLTDEKIKVMIKSFITRVSVGVQSLSKEVLDAETRRYINPKSLATTLLKLVDGFSHKENSLINVDLMAGLEMQTPELLLNDFRFLDRLGVHKITVYPKRYSNERDDKNNDQVYRLREEFMDGLNEFVAGTNRYWTNADVENKYINVFHYNYLRKDTFPQYNYIYQDRIFTIDGKINSCLGLGENCLSWFRGGFGYQFVGGKYLPNNEYSDDQEFYNDTVNDMNFTGLLKYVNS